MLGKTEEIMEGVFDKMAVAGTIGYTLAVIVTVIGIVSSLLVRIVNPSFYTFMLMTMLISLVSFSIGVVGLAIIGRFKFRISR